MSFLKSLFGGGQSDVDTIDVNTAFDRVKSKQVLLVDVRNESEWREGVAQGAQTVCLSDPNLADKVFNLAKEDTGASIAVICRSGMRSSRAAKILARAGFSDVCNVRGGMMAWTGAGLPTKSYRG